MKKTITFLFLFMTFSLQAQDVENVASLVGAVSVEELEQSEIDHFEVLRRRKLYINLASSSRLVSSGLLSPYQAASVLDYRSRNGDILSFTELAALDGFGPEYAEALKPYVSLQPSSSPLQQESRRLGMEMQLRECLKLEKGEPLQSTYGGKLRISYGERLLVSATTKRPYGEGLGPPESFTGGIVLYGRRLLGKIVVGDYNVRFGQGLVSWSGFSLTGFSSVQAFSKRPTGISPSWSYNSTAAGRGVAADFNLGRFVLSAALSEHPVLNLTHYARIGQLGCSVTRQAVSADSRFAAGPVDFFAEAAYDRVNDAAAFVAGAIYNPAYLQKVGILVRCYPADYEVDTANAASTVSKMGDQYGLTVGGESSVFTTTFDAMLKPSEKLARYRFLASLKTNEEKPLILQLRFTERFIPSETLAFRTDLRGDLKWSSGAWLSTCRAEMLLCKSLGLLCYAETGCKGLEIKSGRMELNAFGRATLFHIDEWDDRIYVYERDAPGNFSVPAYNGRGFALSAYAGLKHYQKNARTYLYARVSLVSYPWNPEPKPSRAELRLQAAMDF